MAAEETQLHQYSTAFSQEGSPSSPQFSPGKLAVSHLSTAERKALGYETEALKPLTLRHGKYQAMVKNSEKWVKARAHLLRERLPINEPEEGGAEHNLRGFLLELLGYEALNRICAESGVPFRVLYAPFQLDMSTRTDKGGDLLLVKEYKDGAYAPIALIDIKRHGGTEKLRSGMHWGINRALPSLVVTMSGMMWEDTDNTEFGTTEFITQKMRRIADYQEEDFLALLSQAGQERFLQTMRERVGKACSRTEMCIRKQRYNAGLERELLSKLAITQLILGEQVVDLQKVS